MNFKKYILTSVAACAMMAANFANATVVTVGAAQNSINGGWSFDSNIHVDKGQQFTVTVDPNQQWNFANGASGYWYNADGMVNGWTIQLPNPDGTTFVGSWASLIAQIGSGTSDAGNYFTVGTHYSGIADASGDLNFYFVDSDAYNNVGSVAANVQVPEPASLAIFWLGLMGLTLARRNAAKK